MRPPDSLPNQTLERRTRSVIYGNEIQPSLRDVACLRCAPNAEALGYCHPVPPGRDPRGVSSWIQPRSGQTNAPLLSRQCGNSFVTQPWCDGEWAYPDTTTRNFLPLPARNERGGNIGHQMGRRRRGLLSRQNLAWKPRSRPAPPCGCPFVLHRQGVSVLASSIHA